MTTFGGLSVELRQSSPMPLDVHFSCDRGELLAIYGPSGSGKTTMLRAIAGLYTPEHTMVSCAGALWSDTGTRRHVPTADRRVGFLFQDYALFPHMTARANVTAALGAHPRHERAALADRWLSMVHLRDVAARRPSQLSGGQQQRVALARAMARQPDVLLLDEPFAASDARLRTTLHDELDNLRLQAHMPVVLVTHSIADVRRLATHVLIIEAGRTVAGGTVSELSARLDSPWADTPSDAGSVLDATVREVDRPQGLATLSFPGGTLVVPARTLVVDAAVRVHVPAHDVILATSRPANLSLHNTLEGRVTGVRPLDDERALVRIAVGSSHLLAEVTRNAVARLSLAADRPVFALMKSVSLEVYPRGHASRMAPP